MVLPEANAPHKVDLVQKRDQSCCHRYSSPDLTREEKVGMVHWERGVWNDTLWVSKALRIEEDRWDKDVESSVEDRRYPSSFNQR